MPEQNSVTNKPIIQDENKRKRKKLIIILLFILTAIIFIFIGVFIYNVWNKKSHLVSDEKKVSQSSDCTYNGKTYQDGASFEATDGCNSCSCTDKEVTCTQIVCNNQVNSEKDPYEGWKTYTNTQWKITFKYPSDWKLEEDFESALGFYITVTSTENFKIGFSSYDDSYPYYCIYSDTDLTKIPPDEFGFNREFSEYRVVKNSEATFRISKYDDSTGGNDEFTVCKLQSDNLFMTDMVYVTYMIPIDIDSPATIDILDLIMLAYEKLE